MVVMCCENIFDGKSKLLLFHKKILCFFGAVADSTIDLFPFMGSPLPLIVTLAIYLWLVIGAGPKLMQNRNSLDISSVIKVYNIFQVAACTWFVYKFHNLGFSFRNTWKCFDDLKPGFEDVTHKQMWWFLMLRTFELIETIFFVLRKKWNQVTVLHLYHHMSTITLLWLHFKYSAGEF